MRSRSGIESAFISRSWRSLVQPRMGRQFIAWRRQPQGIPNEPTIVLSPRGGGRGNSRQGRRWCRVARADRDSQVSALGVGLPSGAPFRCAHRIAHRKRGPGQQGLRVGANLLGRNLDGNQIAWKYRTCAGHVAAGAGWPGGPRFPGFGVGRGFAIWGPFPVHAPDSVPETWTSLNKNLALHTALPVVDGFGGFVFTHGHFGFQKQRAAPVCMILMIFLKARPRAGAIKTTPATDLMVFPAVPDHSRPRVRLALSCRPRLGFGSRGLVVRSLRHLPWGSRRQAMKFRRSAAGKSRCRTPLPSRGPELSPEWQAFLNHAHFGAFYPIRLTNQR